MMSNIINYAAISLRLILLAIPTVTINVIRAVFLARSRGVNVRVSVRNAIVKGFMTSLQPRQLQSILPSGLDSYRKWVKGKQISPDDGATWRENIDTLADGEAKLFWIGEKNTQYSVVLFFHGGGYVLPMSKGHLEWAEYFRSTVKQAGGMLSVALLDYSLCPESTYPTQMCQAVMALDHLLALGYNPQQIVIGGDSAGGHLSLSLLSHLLHKYKREILPSFQLQQPLAGCFLVSPLVSLDLDTSSYVENLHSDLLSIPMIRDWGADLFRGTTYYSETAKGEAWGMALLGGSDWWNSIEQVVKRIYVVGGGQELFRDHISMFGKLLKGLPNIDVQVFIDMYEAHDTAYMDFETAGSVSESTRRLGTWMVESLQMAGNCATKDT